VALVARGFGARDVQTANRAANQSFVLALVLGAAMSVFVYLAAPFLAGFLTRTAAAREMMTTYLRIDALGFTLYSTVLVCGNVIRAAGDTRTPMVIMIVVNIINALVSAALVFGWLGPKLGVVGIALGTVVARSLGGLMLTGVLLYGLRGLKLRPRWLRPDYEIIRRILRVGLPAAGEASLMWISHIGFIKVVAHTAVGDAATVNYAAHMIGVPHPRWSVSTLVPSVPTVPLEPPISPRCRGRC
jgi:Na+-driven multidrug efflux pump